MNELPGVKCLVPKGAFYAFPDFSHYLGMAQGKLLKDTFDISEYILRSSSVVTLLPGDGFGAPGHIRFLMLQARKT